MSRGPDKLLKAVMHGSTVDIEGTGDGVLDCRCRACGEEFYVDEGSDQHFTPNYGHVCPADNPVHPRLAFHVAGRSA